MPARSRSGLMQSGSIPNRSGRIIMARQPYDHALNENLYTAMKLLLTVGIILCRLALWAQPAVTPTHFNHFVFRVPEGWRGAQIADYYVIAPPDLGPGELL